MIEKKGKKLS